MCSPEIPDPGPTQIKAIEANQQLGNRQLDMEQNLMDYFKARQTGLDALQTDVTQRQQSIADQNAQEGADLFQYQKEVFRPVEESLVSQAMQESTPQFYQQYAEKAAAQLGQQQNTQQGEFERYMSSLGVNPNSGAYVAGRRNMAIANAADSGATMNDARDRAEALSFARRADVAGLGKGLVGAGQGSYGVALQGEQGALSGANETNRTAGATIGTPAQYGQLGTTAYGNAGNEAADLYRSQVGAATAGSSSSGDAMKLLGTALGAWASTGFAT